MCIMKCMARKEISCRDTVRVMNRAYSEVEEAGSKVRLERSKARSQDLDRAIVHWTIVVSLILLGLTILVALVSFGQTVTVPIVTMWYVTENVLVYIDNVTL